MSTDLVTPPPLPPSIARAVQDIPSEVLVLLAKAFELVRAEGYTEGYADGHAAGRERERNSRYGGVG